MTGNRIPSWTRTIAWLVVACSLFAALLPLDSWIATWMDIDPLPGDLVKAINLMELFGHGAGAALVVTVLLVLMPERWQDSTRMILGFVLAGVTVSLLKMVVFRYRPAFFYPGFTGEEQSWIGTSISGADHGDALLNGKYLTDSFPSGHSAQVAAMAVMLSILFPRGRYLFATVAVLACCQRVMGHAHWASDTVAGVAVGIFCGVIAFRLSLPGKFRRDHSEG